MSMRRPGRDGEGGLSAGESDGDVELAALLQDALRLWGLDLAAVCEGNGVRIGQVVVRRGGSAQRWSLACAAEDVRDASFPSVLMLLAALRRALT